MEIREKRSKVQMYQVRMTCDCGGEMIYDKSAPVILTFPPQYQHKCNKCGKIETFSVNYPHLEQEEIK